ncbi:uncharacterized protein LOC135087316 [Ostrinia nubilalis]|uniref:uncharacterized protein LOC135087316 n=1 Tax=Ostrinia nubilalis TaxID=29057 RepID=UPI0030824819
MKTCLACNTDAHSDEYVECTKCNGIYHYPCLNIHRDNLSPDAISKWQCPMCMSKQRKGDNSARLARPSTPTSQAEISFMNVTRRAAASKPVTAAAPNQNDDFIRRSDLRELLREEMSNILKSHNAELTSTLSKFSEKISNLSTSVEFMSEKFDRITEEFQQQKQEITTLKNENAGLRTEVDNLNSKLQLIDQLSRASSLELQCVPEKKAENVVQIIKQLGRVVNCPINDHDIHYCSRVAKLNPNSTRPRTIIAKFSSPRMRDSVLSAVVRHNRQHSQDKLNTTDFGFDPEKKSPVFVIESLSHENKQLHAAARQRARELKYKFVWIRAGRIFMRKNESSEAIFIRNSSVLDKL